MRRLLIALAALLLVGSVTGPAGADTAPSGRWMPSRAEPWQWLLDHPLNVNSATDMTGAANQPTVYDIDGFDNPASTVAALHARGFHAICYISGGSWENWRADAASLPASVKGRTLEGWAGEKWLDVRQTSVLGPIMAARADMCASKGFDAIEWDNVDGYANRSGFALTGAQQLAYNRLLAQITHERGMSAVLKNDVDQTAQLEPDFEFALNEECFDYDECDAYASFLAAGKTVLHVEYSVSVGTFCPTVKAMGFDSMRKRLDLDGWRRPC